MIPAIVLNIIIIVLEIRALLICFPERKWRLLIFYTQLSNMITTVSCVLFLIAGQAGWVTAVRYLATCMMLMTFLITTCVLVPMGGDPKFLLWSKNGLIHHILCPIINLISYLIFEKNAGWEMLPLPILVTLAYGIVMISLNAARKVDGPYPFFKVHDQSALATVLWIVVLLAVIAGISALVCVL